MGRINIGEGRFCSDSVKEDVDIKWRLKHRGCPGRGGRPGIADDICNLITPQGKTHIYREEGVFYVGEVEHFHEEIPPRYCTKNGCPFEYFRTID